MSKMRDGDGFWRQLQAQQENISIAKHKNIYKQLELWYRIYSSEEVMGILSYQTPILFSNLEVFNVKIIRYGKEIELLDGELIEAYAEQEHNYDVEDITRELDWRDGFEDSENAYVKQILNDAELISKIAFAKRRRMNCYYMGSSAAVEESIDEAIHELKESEANTAK